MITVEKKDETTFLVTVKDQSETSHRVKVSKPYYEELTAGRIAPEELVRKSFEFLLEREPNTSIMTSFDLPIIGRYFPEYEKTIKKRLT